MGKHVKAGFVEPMLLLRTDALPDDPTRWEYQLKFDGYGLREDKSASCECYLAATTLFEAVIEGARRPS